ncbi:uncharacterized protein [Aegilops tauschii subsp. strangulata]|uniref:uncharacterized protein n=1 Tax=Aegilops tauschii subsp. strangulata TaxID=200361 RepID=UPI003CC87EC8
MFFCMNGAREGFLKGCRPFIGVNGCFIKLTTGAQLLAATGGEVGQFGPYTIMSDRQKGLLNAVFPNCNQRFCLRHLYANFQNAGFRGEDLKKFMDNASYAYNEHKFNIAMNGLRAESEEAWEWLPAIPKKTWARHGFYTNCKTDLVVNNLSEVFNKYILDVRRKPIRTMCDGIKDKQMVRWHRNREWKGSKMGNNTSLQKWGLSAIPCNHAISAINKAKRKPQDYVSKFFKKDFYVAAYEPMIFPVPGEHDWTRAPGPDIEPPAFKVKRGRKKEKRIKGKFEVPKTKDSSRMGTITCGYSKQLTAKSYWSFSYTNSKTGKSCCFYSYTTIKTRKSCCYFYYMTTIWKRRSWQRRS